MATTGDGVSTYQSGGAGGKLRKKPNRRSVPSTPYDRPPTALRSKSPSLLAKLVEPASRLIHVGADRLFGVFRKRLPSIPARLPGTSEEPRNGPQEAVSISAPKNFTEVVKPRITVAATEPRINEGGNLASISVAATEISDLENLFQQKTFTRSEIERLTALLLSKTTDSNVVEGDKEKLPCTSNRVPRPDAFTSGTLNKHVEEREIRNLDAAISTPVVSLRAFEDDGASPADLAKAYMGTKPLKLSPLTTRPSSPAFRQDLLGLNNAFTVPKTPTTSLAPMTAPSIKTSENGLTTFRSRGRSALYNMPRTPYYRGPSTLNQKGVASPSAWEHEGSIGSSRMAAKRRISVLDDIGSGGPMRRIRQKASLLSQQSSLSKDTIELGSSQKPLLRDEPDPKGKKAVEETGEISKRNQGYGSVPTESSQMALKIFEQLDRMSPKEKSTGSKLAVTIEKNDSPKFVLGSQDNQKSEGQNRVLFPDGRESTFQSKYTVKENGLRNIAGYSNVLGSVNGNVTVPVSGNASIVTKAGSPTKQAFLMSAHEDSLELDDNNHSNGHTSFSPSKNKIGGASVSANNDVSSAAAHAEIIQTPAPPKVCQTALPEVDSIPKIPELETIEGSVFNNQKMSVNFPTSTSQSSNSRSSVISQPTSIVGTVTPQNKLTVFPTFGTSTSDSVGPDGDKPISPDARSLGPTSLKNSTVNIDQVQFLTSNKDDIVNNQKPLNLVGNSGPSSSANLTTAPASGIFSFGGATNNSIFINGTSASSPSVFASSSSFQSSGSNTDKNFSTRPSSLFSSATTALLPATTSTATFASNSAFSTSVSTPIFSFGSTTASSTSASLAPSPFSSTSIATLVTNGFQTTTQAASTAVTQPVPFKFGSGTSGMPTSTSASSLFSSSAPSFGLTSAATSAETKSGSSTTSVYGSGFNLTPSFGLSSTVASSETKFGSTPFSFGAYSTTSTPSAASSSFMFGSSNAGASTGSSMFSFSSKLSSPAPDFGTSSPNNNDHMSMEDSMVDDTKQTPSASIPAFGQPSSGTPGFIFGSAATPAPVTPQPPMVPFQFSGQTSQPQPQSQPFSQNNFQPPGGSPFNAGGSFSLGSGGDDKSNRRIVKVKRQNRRK